MPVSPDSFRVVRTVMSTGRDLRQAARALRRSPGFTAAALLTLALCIGANAAIFSMLYTLALKPLPFPEPDRLIEVANNYPQAGRLQAQCSVQQYLDYRAHVPALADVGLYRHLGMALKDDEGIHRFTIARVTYGFFGALGVRPLLGNFFAPEDSNWGNDAKLVLTETLWRSHFHADPDVIGRTVQTTGTPYTIVGVAPRAVEVIDPTVKLFKPTVWHQGWITEMNRHATGYALIGRMFARLKPGATMEEARAQMEFLDQRFYASASTEYRNLVDGSGYHLSLRPMREGLLGAARLRLYLLQGAALAVLLIGCVNLTHLLLVRAGARESELALRGALGGGRRAIAGQWAMEPLLLTAGGGLAGLAAAWAGIKLVNRYALPFLPPVDPFRFDGAVVVCALLLCGLAVAGITLIPLRQILQSDLMSVLRRGTTNTRARPRGRGLRALLVPIQVSLCLVLLTAAGLLIRSFLQAAHGDPGFQTRNIVTVRTVVQAFRTQGPNAVAQLQARIFASLRALPGVEAVGMAAITPLHEEYPLLALHVRGAGPPAGGAAPMVRMLPVRGDYFGALGVPLRRGRLLDERDEDEKLRTVLIDDRAAERFFPGQDPVGRQIALGEGPFEDEESWWTIAGVVGYADYRALDEVGGLPFCIMPESKFGMAGNSYVVRTMRPASEILPLVQARIRAIAPEMEQYHAGALDDFAAESLGNRRALGLFAGLFAAVAVFLALVGIYGVTAVDVAQRTREIGVRAAVGATRRHILRMILTAGARKAALGVVLGGAGSWLTGRLLAGSLFGVPPHDPLTMGGAAAALFLAAMVAGFLPAWRAAGIDPARALREE